MKQKTAIPISRRRFFKTTAATALAAGAGPAVIIPGRAQPRTLKILRTKSFSMGFHQWFDAFVSTWSKQNAIQVTVDFFGLRDRYTHATAEIAAQQGHDLFFFTSPPAAYEDEVIDHREIYEECVRRYGNADEVSLRSTYNPRTDKFFAFPVHWLVYLVNYRKDLWDAVGRQPDTWENVRRGGRHIKLLHERPVGIALAPSLDAESSLMAILFSFGASVQDNDARPALKSGPTLEALKYVKALYEEAMSEEVLGWDASSNNRAMLGDEISLTLNSNVITRAGENKQLPLTSDIWLTRPPQGPVQRLTPANVIACYVIWKFAQQIDAAKQFLVDYIGQSRGRFLAGGFFNYPCFPNTVPDLAQLLANDASAHPRDKYQVMAEQADWTVNYGYPGYDNAAISEVYNIGLIPTMFASAATGKMTPEEALTQADQEVRKIYDQWHALGKI